MLEPSFLLHLRKGEKSFGRTIWDSASRGKFKTFFFPRNVFLGYFGLCLCLSGSRVSCSDVNLGQYLSDGSEHKFHVLFLAREAMLRLGQADALWQPFICYEILAGAEHWIMRWICFLPLSLDVSSWGRAADSGAMFGVGLQLSKGAAWVPVKSSVCTQTPLKSSQQSTSGR